eukprot:789303-Rhodomonas_salina.1
MDPQTPGVGPYGNRLTKIASAYLRSGQYRTPATYPDSVRFSGGALPSNHDFAPPVARFCQECKTTHPGPCSSPFSVAATAALFPPKPKSNPTRACFNYPPPHPPPNPPRRCSPAAARPGVGFG